MYCSCGIPHGWSSSPSRRSPSQLEDPDAECVRRPGFRESDMSSLEWDGGTLEGKDVLVPLEDGGWYCIWVEGDNGERVVMPGEAVGYPPDIRGE